MISLDINQANYFILKKHHLTDDEKEDNIAKIVDDIWGLHATSPKTPYLSLFARTKNFNKTDLDKELGKNKTLCKFRCIRRTVHIIKKEEVPIAYSATRIFVEPASNRFMQYIGVTEDGYKTFSKSILKILPDNGMTAKEIKEKLKTDSNISSIVNLMCDQGLLVRGLSRKGWKSNVHTYYIFSKYFPNIRLDELKEDNAKKLLVKHYIRSYSPVTKTDISWWTGFTKGEVNKILKYMDNQLDEIKISNLNDNYIVFNSDKKELQIKDLKMNAVNLLPCLDPYIMGYKKRNRYTEKKNHYYIFDCSGNATSSILFNGKIIGVWDFEEVKEDSTVKFFLFKNFKKSIIDAIYYKAEEVGKFILDKRNIKVNVKKSKSMVTLDKRTAGGFMSPLKFS